MVQMAAKIVRILLLGLLKRQSVFPVVVGSLWHTALNCNLKSNAITQPVCMIGCVRYHITIE